MLLVLLMEFVEELTHMITSLSYIPGLLLHISCSWVSNKMSSLIGVLFCMLQLGILWFFVYVVPLEWNAVP